MSNEADDLRRTLGDLLRLLKKAETCPTCEGPSSAFDEGCKHGQEWKAVHARAEKLLQAGKIKPN